MSTPAGHLKSAVPRLVVLAKAPQPGLSKTRLCPPLSSHEAADLAEIALIATLQAVMSTPGCEPMLVLEGPVGSWTPSIEVLPQRGITLGERLTAAFDDAHGPALVVGMDTPQVTPELLTEGLNHLRRPDLDAVFGPTTDGGYWAVGLKKAHPEAFVDVPMSTPWTGAAQRVSFERLALRCATLPELSDFDHFLDARRVALEMPGSEFARAVDSLCVEEASA
ncbi:MAG TPA: TIGR04282 family arsenosugar biosynthesis glycosyltransferase [Actinomycetota bacterium]|nr:TIGR04282 family arsenosugar biosynthesis glycosyltransferase [Actinomycetota bacterium]